MSRNLQPSNFNAKLLAWAEAERQRVARELHDDICQRLALLADSADRLRTDPSFEGASRDRLDQLVEQARTLSEDLRQISHRLHPAIVQDLGLSLAVRALMADFTEHTGIPANFIEDNLPRELPDDVGTAIYRIVQEALWNVRKHAGQTSVLVTLRLRARQLVLLVSDFGAGFDPSLRNGLGLTSMRERAGLVGGTFHLLSAVGSGTTIQVQVPIAVNQAN